MKFDGTNWILIGPAGFSTGAATDISLAFSPAGELHVAYSDETNGKKISLKLYTGALWQNVGNDGFSNGHCSSTSLAFNTSGVPYLGFVDSSTGGWASVMEYDSIATGIPDMQQLKILLHPNPATDKIVVKMVEEASDVRLDIVNAYGQILLSQRITEPKPQVDISALPAGVYFVRLTGDKTVQVGKFVKQ